MRGKLTLLVGVGVGYVLGSRAGRQRYEQMKAKAKDVWSDPRVQEKADQAKHLAQERADQAKHLAQEKAHDAGQSLKDKVTSSSDEPEPTVTTPRPL